MTHRLLGPSGAYWKTRQANWTTHRLLGLLELTEPLAGQLDDPKASGAFWGLLNNWQANWTIHRLLGPSGAYWTTGRPTGQPKGFWGLLGLTEQLAGQLDDPQASGAFWGLLNNWQANWMTHRLLGPSGAYWMTHWMTHSLFNVNWLQDPLNDPL